MSKALGIIVVLCFLAIVAVPLSTAWADAPTSTYNVTNESVVLHNDSRTAVESADDAEGFNDTVDVYNPQGEEVNESRYVWYNETGEIQANESSTDGLNATIDYQYYDRSNPSDAGAALLRIVMLILAVAVVAGGGFAALVLAASGLTASGGR